MKLKCELDGHLCILPDFISQFFLKAPLMYISTVNSNGNPRIQPTIFINESGKCNLAFLVRKDSILALDIKKHRKIALTTDKTHPTDPSHNTGIMIEAFGHLVVSPKKVKLCLDELQKKYCVDTTIKIMGIDVVPSYIKIEAFPKKIIFWKGPFFKRFSCKRR